MLPLCTRDSVLTAVRYAFGAATDSTVGTLRAGAYFAREGAMVRVWVRTCSSLAAPVSV